MMESPSTLAFVSMGVILVLAGIGKTVAWAWPRLRTPKPSRWHYKITMVNPSRKHRLRPLSNYEFSVYRNYDLQWSGFAETEEKAIEYAKTWIDDFVIAENYQPKQAAYDPYTDLTIRPPRLPDPGGQIKHGGGL